MSITKSVRIAFLIYLLFLSAYLLTMKGYLEVSDSAFSLRTAESIIDNHSLAIKSESGDSMYVYENNGKVYSHYGIGLPIIWIPFVLLSRVFWKFTSLPLPLVTNFIVSSYSIFFGAGLSALFFLVQRQFGISRKDSLLLSLALGLGTICWRYSVYDFSEITQTFFLLVAVYGVLKNSVKFLTLTAVCLSYAFLIKILNIIYIPVFLVYIAFRNRANIRICICRIFLVAITLSAAIIVIFFLDYIRFGNIFETGYGKGVFSFTSSYIKNLWNLIFSLNKGFLIYSPLLLLSVLSFPKFIKAHKAEAMLFLSLIAINLCVYPIWSYYEGGWAWGPRYQVIITPLVLLPAGVLIKDNRFFKKVFIIFFCLSFTMQVISVLQKDQEYHTLNTYIHDNELLKKMPSDIIGTAIILKHKILKKDNIYSLREFGLHNDQKIDLSEFETLRGVNLWYCHLSRFFNRPIIKYIPILFLPFLFILFVKILKACVEKEDEEKCSSCL